VVNNRVKRRGSGSDNKIKDMMVAMSRIGVLEMGWCRYQSLFGCSVLVSKIIGVFGYCEVVGRFAPPQGSRNVC